jgi:hypothetical protein
MVIDPVFRSGCIVFDRHSLQVVASAVYLWSVYKALFHGDRSFVPAYSRPASLIPQAEADQKDGVVQWCRARTHSLRDNVT